MQDFFNPMGNMQQQMYGAVAPQQTLVSDPKSFCQTLTVEQANLLKKHVEEFSLTISERDRLAAICMHREPGTGKSTLVDAGDGDGGVTCLLCGKTFHIVDTATEEQIILAVNNLLDVIQTSKTLYLDMPAESARNFYIIIALIEKIPGLFKIASNNMRAHEKEANSSLQQATTNLAGMYNMLASPWASPMGGFGTPMGSFGGYGAPNMMGGMPQMGAPMAAPMGSTPMGSNPFFTAPQPAAPQMAPGMNPAAGYQPQQTAYAYTPSNLTAAATVAQPDPAAAPQVAAPTAQTDGSVVNVSQVFQA